MPNDQCQMDAQAKAYFHSLPDLLKTQIVQSGVKLTTRQDLETYRKNALSDSESQQ